MASMWRRLPGVARAESKMAAFIVRELLGERV
jgi:hypothetical protein